MDALEHWALSVNGTEWSLRDMLKLASMESEFTAVEKSIRRTVTLEYAARNHITINEQEWKAAANEMRQQLGLYSVAETSAWLSARGLVTADLFETAKARLLTEKVKRFISEDRIDAYFLTNKLSFDRACVSQLVTGSKEQAQELLFQMEEGESFYKLAQTYCLQSNSRYDGGYVGWAGRHELSGEEEAFVFGAEAGQTGGPFPVGSFYRLLHVWEVAPAVLNEEVRIKLADAIFEEWLNAAVQEASIDIRLWRGLAGEPLR